MYWKYPGQRASQENMHQVLIKYIWEKALLEKLYSRKCACSKVMSTCCALPRHAWRDVEMTLGGVKGFVIQVIGCLSVVEIYTQVCNGMSTEISQTVVFLSADSKNRIQETQSCGIFNTLWLKLLLRLNLPPQTVYSTQVKAVDLCWLVLRIVNHQSCLLVARNKQVAAGLLLESVYGVGC